MSVGYVWIWMLQVIPTLKFTMHVPISCSGSDRQSVVCAHSILVQGFKVYGGSRSEKACGPGPSELLPAICHPTHRP